jgi:hypothetical protein
MFGGGEPSLSRELRRDTFAQKMKLTDEQKEALSELDMQRGEFFRSLPRGNGGGPGTEDFEKRMQDMQAKMKEFEAQAVAILTPEQKAIWEERKVEIKAEQEAGRNERPDMGRFRGDGNTPTPQTPTPQAPTPLTRRLQKEQPQQRRLLPGQRRLPQASRRPKGEPTSCLERRQRTVKPRCRLTSDMHRGRTF